METFRTEKRGGLLGARGGHRQVLPVRVLPAALLRDSEAHSEWQEGDGGVHEGVARESCHPLRPRVPPRRLPLDFEGFLVVLEC